MTTQDATMKEAKVSLSVKVTPEEKKAFSEIADTLGKV